MEKNKTFFEVIKTGNVSHNIKCGDNNEYVFLLPENFKKNFSCKRRIEIRQNADIKLFFFYLGGKDCNIKIHYKINSLAKIDHRVFVLLDNNQIINIEETFEFVNKKNFGRFNSSAICADKSRCRYFGNVVIGNNALNTDAFLTAQAHLFGKSSFAQMLPHLQINANSAKAGHSAKVERFCQEDLFYLLSRGISLENSINLLLDGIILNETGKINDNNVRQDIYRMAKEKCNNIKI